MRKYYTEDDMNRMVKQVITLQKNTPKDGSEISDADTILEDFIDQRESECDGVALELLDIYRNTRTDPMIFDHIFNVFTGKHFVEYLNACIDGISRNEFPTEEEKQASIDRKVAVMKVVNIIKGIRINQYSHPDGIRKYVMHELSKAKELDTDAFKASEYVLKQLIDDLSGDTLLYYTKQEYVNRDIIERDGDIFLRLIGLSREGEVMDYQPMFTTVADEYGLTNARIRGIFMRIIRNLNRSVLQMKIDGIMMEIPFTIGWSQSDYERGLYGDVVI